MTDLAAMEPPFKRPRLSILGQRQPASDANLDSARLINDTTLKSRFEAIFEKYSKDFTDIGDEVDIITGEIVVNRGHIERMTAETDPGQIRYEGINGRSLLQAMAVDENEDDTFPRPDDVLQSIETIAENVGLMDDSSMDDSEDSLFNTSEMSSMSPPLADDFEQDPSNTTLDPYNSDADSLFELDQSRRSLSVDSLFENVQNPDERVQHLPEAMKSPVAVPSSPNPITDDNGILAKFGVDIGQQVIELLDQRQDAHIEPAWKIPVRLEPQQIRRQSSNIISASPVDTSPAQQRNQSLWKLPPPPRVYTYVRHESEDPLQAGFSSDHNSTYREGSESDFEDTEEGSKQSDLVKHAATTGECPYCPGSFPNKSGLMAHWDRLIKRSAANRLERGDPHDMELISKTRAPVIRRAREPRLVLYDFRSMVELHEGAGFSFEQIAKQKVLRTRKTGPRLQDDYDKHRTPPDARRSPELTREWTTEEEDDLLELCENSLSTMASIQRGLGGRSELEIGNKLAEIWLAQLRAGRGRSHANSESGRSHAQTNNGLSQTESIAAASRGDAIMEIKEESEDELFG